MSLVSLNNLSRLNMKPMHEKVFRAPIDDCNEALYSKASALCHINAVSPLTNGTAPVEQMRRMIVDEIIDGMVHDGFPSR